MKELKIIKLHPVTLKKINRFRSIKRGYYSLIILIIITFLTVFAELWINGRAIVVHYDGEYYFPTYGDVIPGNTFGLDYAYETDYKQLQDRLKDDPENWVIMPWIPYGPYETDIRERYDSLGNRLFPPHAPNLEIGHLLGTDKTGRDVLARLIYGYRIAIIFATILLIFNYGIGVSLGCLMGYWGGKFDLLFQRLIEILSNIPFLYIVMIVASLVTPNIFTLAIIMVSFGWMTMTWYMRTATYKEKSRDYIMAARSLGASPARVIGKHIIPNTLSLIITFVPFSLSSAIVALTSLDFLGYGLAPPTPSWGELLRQGTERLDAQWIVSSVVIAMIAVLVMITFVGEAIREAFDPKQHSVFR